MTADHIRHHGEKTNKYRRPLSESSNFLSIPRPSPPAPSCKTALELLHEVRARRADPNALFLLSPLSSPYLPTTTGAPPAACLGYHQHLHDNYDDNDWLRLPLGVTELVGAAGAGKTQLALAVCLQAARRQQGTLYLSLKGATHQTKIAQRLEQMLLALQAQQEQSATNNNNNNMPVTTTSASTTTTSVLRRIRIKAVVNQEDLLDLVRVELPRLLLQEAATGTRLLVLDSIADLFRTKEHEQDNNPRWAADRAALFFQLSALLKQLSERHAISILILNQVADTGAGSVIPALGLAWAHCVNRTLEVRRVAPSLPQRRLCLRQSSAFACGDGQEARFCITRAGVHRVHGAHA